MTHLARIAALVTNVPLMIQPAKLAVIASILDGRIGIDAAGLPADIAAKAPSAPQSNRFVGQFELNDPADPRSGRKPYRTTRNGVAVVPVLGSLVNRASYLDALSGLTAYETLKHHIRLAAADPDVAGIVLDIDSPGGEAVGAFEVADVVAAARSVKPVIASVTGLCCSAAYAIASACTKIVVSPSSVTGSIGVVMLHIDRSRRMDTAGLTPTLPALSRRRERSPPSRASPALPQPPEPSPRRGCSTMRQRTITASPPASGSTSTAAVRCATPIAVASTRIAKDWASQRLASPVPARSGDL
jgi:hypothetical protein